MQSLVFLLAEPRRIEEHGSWVKQIGEALGRDLITEKDKSAEFVMPMPHPGIVEGNGECFMVWLKEGMFWILNFRKPYVEDPGEFASGITDASLRGVFATHKAWLSVDLVVCKDEMDQEAIYNIIGKILGALAGPDVLAVYAPELNRCNEFDPSLIEGLSGGKPLEIFKGATFSPVVHVRTEDEQMEAAKEEARRRWPEFVALFQQRDPGAEAPFIIKAPFTDKEHTEFMWVEVVGLEDGLITGSLANTPHRLEGFHEGQTVVVPVDSVADWLCMDANKNPLGGWTNKVIAGQMKRSRGGMDPK